MSTTLSKILMVIALSCLGLHRRDWAFAMMAEFKVAGEEEKPLAFAFGCLTTALRELPTHRQGRLMLARYGTTLAVILPLATLLFVGAVSGYPYIDLPPFASLRPQEVGMTGPVNLVNASAIQALTFLMFLLSARLMLVAWYVVERDWARVAATQRFGAALITTLALFTGVIVREETCVILPLAAFAIELCALTALTRWHARDGMRSDEAETEPAASESGDGRGQYQLR